MARTLLIVAHAPSPNTQCLLDAVVAGAREDSDQDLVVEVRRAFDASPSDVLNADGILLGTTENLGYMSGALKDFFDRVYYPVLEHTQGRPYGCWIRAGHDGTGTRRAIETITTGLRWKAIGEPLLCRGAFDEGFAHSCHQLGMTMAAGLDAGIF